MITICTELKVGLAILLAGCSVADDPADLQRTLHASVDSLYAVDRSIELVEPDDFPIGMIVDAAIDAEGRLFLSDFSSREVRVYSDNGADVRLVGGTGQGPGEYITPTAIDWSDQDRQLAVVDLGNARIIRFQGETLNRSTVSPIEVQLGVRYLRFGPAGQLVGAGLSRSQDFSEERELAFVANGPDTMRFLPIPDQFMESQYTRSIISGLVDAAPRHILAAVSGHPTVYRFDYAGAAVDSVNIPPEVYGGVELPKQVEQGLEFQKKYKWIQGIRAADDGRVAVLELFAYQPDTDEWLQQIVWLPLEGDGPVSITEPCDCRLLGVEGNSLLILRGEAPFRRYVEWRSHR